MNGQLIILAAPPGKYGNSQTFVRVFEAAGWNYFGEFLNWPDLAGIQRKLREGVNVACGTTPPRLDELSNELKALQREFEVIILEVSSWSRQCVFTGRLA